MVLLLTAKYAYRCQWICNQLLLNSIDENVPLVFWRYHLSFITQNLFTVCFHLVYLESQETCTDLLPQFFNLRMMNTPIFILWFWDLTRRMRLKLTMRGWSGVTLRTTGTFFLPKRSGTQMLRSLRTGMIVSQSMTLRTQSQRFVREFAPLTLFVSFLSLPLCDFGFDYC